MTVHKKECCALNGEFDGMRAVSGINNDNVYTVKGTYMDSNGCLKTYGEGYKESFIADTEYSKI